MRPRLASLSRTGKDRAKRDTRAIQRIGRLISIRVFALTAGTLTLTDDLGQTVTLTVPTGSLLDVNTGWTQASTTITVQFTTGWDLGVDDITYN